jgi:hypothetical protein
MRTLMIFLVLPLFGMTQEPVVNTFPSLSIPVYSRGWAMGNTGIAGATSNQQLGYNAAKTAFTQNFHQASFSYLTWMRSISNDSRMLHADYLASINDASAIGFVINYLDLGTIAIRDENGATLGLYKSNEFNIGTAYALQLGGNASLGVAMRFIGSRYFSSTVQNKYSVCGDISYYQFIQLGDPSKKLEWGAVVSNLGPAINLPANAGIGISYTSVQNDAGDQLQVSLDANRLLSSSMKAIRLSAGMEYGFTGQFFLRGGANWEGSEDGNRKYFSLGAGYKGFVSDQSWGIDIHYLVPFAVKTIVSPFQNAYGLTMKLNIGNFQ